jgi:hypothetical protein
LSKPQPNLTFIFSQKWNNIWIHSTKFALTYIEQNPAILEREGEDVAGFTSARLPSLSYSSSSLCFKKFQVIFFFKKLIFKFGFGKQ